MGPRRGLTAVEAVRETPLFLKRLKEDTSVAAQHKHPSVEHHLQAAAHHHAAAHPHLQAAHHHTHGQYEEAKKHATAAHDL
jgi:hypothetical protein